MSFVLLVGGYALSNYWRDGSAAVALVTTETNGLNDGAGNWLRRRLSEERGYSNDYGKSLIILNI